jgi:two-component system chemotaxis response regulator CheY
VRSFTFCDFESQYTRHTGNFCGVCLPTTRYLLSSEILQNSIAIDPQGKPSQGKEAIPPEGIISVKAVQTIYEGPPVALETGILIIESDRAIRKFLARSIQQRGCEPYIAETLEEAYSALSQRHYALILLDSDLPEDGAAILTRIVRRHSSIAQTPIVVISSDDAPENIETAIASGANEFVVKPLTGRGLSKILANYSIQCGGQP